MVAVSLLAWVAVVFGWIHSCFHTTGASRWQKVVPGVVVRQYAWFSGEGRLALRRSQYEFDWGPVIRVVKTPKIEMFYFNHGLNAGVPIGWQSEEKMWFLPKMNRWEKHAIFLRYYSQSQNNMRITHRDMVVSYWLLFVLTSLWPLAFTILWWRRRRDAAAGKCPHCGYDLRASPERCPECGAAAGEVKH